MPPTSMFCTITIVLVGVAALLVFVVFALQRHFTTQLSPIVQRPYLMRRPGDGFTSWIAYQPPPRFPAAVVVQAGELDLPPFLLLPILSDTLSLESFASDRHFHALLAWDDRLARNPPSVVAGTRHAVSTPDPARFQSGLNEGFRTWLATTRGLALSGEGDLLVVRLGVSSVGWAPGFEDHPEKGLVLAETCYRHLRGKSLVTW